MSDTHPRPQRVDIFCRVVDHFGDIGVCWRLARQLAAEQGIAVRLIVDNLKPASRLVPQIDPAVASQSVLGVHVARWDEPFLLDDVADWVIEAFACELPGRYIEAMATRAKAPIWVNLEYLSAEPWVASHHRLPSPHPQHALTKHFFFPGFTDATGGLLREATVSRPLEGRIARPSRALVFTYAGAPLTRVATITQSVQFVIPCTESKEAKVVDGCGFSGENGWEGAPNIGFCQFVPHQDFDRFLGEFDLLFVRGEDSLVRAIWSARPFVWTIYPQHGGAHRPKLEAFLEHYLTGAPVEFAASYRSFSLGWNGFDTGAFEHEWLRLLARFDEWAGHAHAYALAAFDKPDLASNLLSFFGKTAKIVGFVAPHQSP